MRVGGAGRALAFALYCFVAFVVLGEGAVRLSGVASRHLYGPIYERFDGDIPYVHKPNLRRARGWNDTIFNTDALGLRSREGGERYPPKAAGEYRIAMVGDSVTFGEGIATAETFSALVEDRLQAALDGVRVRVFNFGVSAYSVQQMAVTVERRVAAIEPDLVVTVLIPADFDLSRIGTLDDWGSVRPRGTGEELAWVRHWLRRMHLVYFLLDVERGWLPEWTSAPLDGVPTSYAYVTRLHAACKARHFDCGIGLVSTKIDEGFGPVATALANEGLPILDLTALRDEFTVEQYNAGKHDPHPSAAAHRRIAEELVPWILARRAARSPAP